MGKAALYGLEGVRSIQSGFKDRKEANTVIYDPDKITLEEMEKALKKAGTYIGTKKGSQ